MARICGIFGPFRGKCDAAVTTPPARGRPGGATQLGRYFGVSVRGGATGVGRAVNAAVVAAAVAIGVYLIPILEICPPALQNKVSRAGNLTRIKIRRRHRLRSQIGPPVPFQIITSDGRCFVGDDGALRRSVAYKLDRLTQPVVVKLIMRKIITGLVRGQSICIERVMRMVRISDCRRYHNENQNRACGNQSSAVTETGDSRRNFPHREGNQRLSLRSKSTP